jgi:4-methyl-5(b-hydroxyethyl)-thiazole monophosphate biosynthesis
MGALPAPAVALASHGLIDAGTPATCYPASKFREALPEAHDHAVVVSGNLVTSQGPGTAIQFALQLGQELFGAEKREQIAKEMLSD